MRLFNARDRLKILAGGAAALATGCGNGSNSGVTPPLVTTPPPAPPQPTGFEPTAGQFKNTFAANFQIGAAIQDNQILDADQDSQILKDQFNSISAEYQMKADIIAPTEGVFDWTVPDAMVQFAEDNGMVVRGHALLWHRSTPDYFLQGTPAEVRTKLENYVTEVVSRYRGRIFAWDVVNEVITDDDSASDPYRRSNWWEASGGNADYIDWAFNAARAADPGCLLFINEYSTRFAGKRGRYIRVIRDMLDRGVPVDGVGHQMHLTVETQANDALAAIDAIDSQFMGLVQHVTELDVSLYPDPGSCFDDQTGCRADYGSNIPDSVLRAQAELYRDLFNGFTERSSITSVSTWGISDEQSWLNSFPIVRTNAPLLWDRNRDAKSALQAILDPDFTP